ncbi:TVP38/TMEM64 family protein [Amphibacillus sp. MSJ-3]|uniref:TVP38/TMEM64 family protein n=1 Tax=Amphibacillus sp. MSJ-3 TaxID=2841505 RepID=UPI001C0EDB95|nr:TVP38/TMEM64 family protein [Amphibacillus sp. MSJ-3]MBU5594019.1 TVP38/TMEM64 family protein [Amphibacillus sp. MSJ-3]
MIILILLTNSSITIVQIRELLETNQYDTLIEKMLVFYEGLGPIPGILLPFIEALLPFLPLMAIVVTNAVAYGLFRGFFYSWLGASLGAITVFLIIRHFRHIKVLAWIHNNHQVQRVTGWIERRGFGPLFILLCFPFSLSSVINLVSALSGVSLFQFALAILFGKAVMIFSVAYVGDSLTSFAESPIKTILVAVGIVLFWLLGKWIERRISINDIEPKQLRKRQ